MKELGFSMAPSLITGGYWREWEESSSKVILSVAGYWVNLVEWYKVVPQFVS